MSELRETLQSIAVLQGLSESELQQIASIAELLDFAEGSVLFRENSPADAVYLVLTGTTALEICAPSVGCRKILTVGKGELLGWSPVLQNARFTATARAISAVSAVRIPGAQLVDLCENDPRLGYHFMQRVAVALSQRLNATRLQLLNVFTDESTAQLMSPELPSG